MAVPDKKLATTSTNSSYSGSAGSTGKLFVSNLRVMEEVRRFKFSLEEARSERGVVKLIGRASPGSSGRCARRDNLLFDEKSLSKNHAMLGLKLLDPLEPNVHIIDQFRIYIKDLGSTYGIVDLNSEESDPFVIDLKNGERFGLVGLKEPISMYQCRAAKLKFQVNLQYYDAKKGVFECIVRDVSFDDSPATSRPTSSEEYGVDQMESLSSSSSSLSSSSSSSDWNFSEEFSIIRETPLESVNGYSEEEEDYTSSSHGSVEDEGYSVVDLLAASHDSEEWDILESEDTEEERKYTCECSEKRILARNKCLIINCEARERDENSDKKQSTGITKTLMISAMVGFVFGFLGTVILLVGLALKEMD